MTRRYIDPHLDPLRAPSRLGQHPHLVPDGPSRVNPQGMYEYRQPQGGVYRPMPRPRQQPMGQVQQAPQQPQQPPQQPGLFDNPLVLLGLGAIAMYALMRSREKDEPRQNPAPAPAPTSPPQPQSFVVVSPGAQPVPVYTAMPTGVHAPEQKQLPAPLAKVVTDPMPEVQEALEGVVEKAQDKAIDTTVKTAKKEYVRVTTQARDPETGSFLPAGTAEPRIEGALTAKELREKAKKKVEAERKRARNKARRRRRR